MVYIVEVEGETFRIELDGDVAVVDGVPVQLDIEQIGGLPLYSILVDHESAEVAVDDDGHACYSVILRGEMYSISVRPESAVRLAPAVPVRSNGVLRARMPGLVTSVPAEVGRIVAQGDTLVVVESMKMENPLPAGVSGTVQTVHVKVGDTVERDQPLVTLAEATGEAS